ncbi:MAG: aminoacyl-tRNA hydrolase, partial [Muricauda sp.]|nr:aminoacyl-tRNA hydrolase [Allomuricauda sp.]
MPNFIEKLFGKPKQLLQETDPMKKFLIVGLGNIGSEYDETRHNIGFKILDFLAEQEDFTFENAK